jgi:hypothetical protein
MDMTEKSIVYVVQNQLKMTETGVFVPRYDLNTAKSFGEFHYCIGPHAKPFDVENCLEELRESMWNITSDDYLLLLGNPILIGLATMVASEHTDSLHFLQWHGKNQRYQAVFAQLN